MKKTLLIDFIYNFCPNKEFVLMGDFNLPSVPWNDYVPDQNIAACDAMFLDFIYTLGLHQLVLEPIFIHSGRLNIYC